MVRRCIRADQLINVYGREVQLAKWNAESRPPIFKRQMDGDDWGAMACRSFCTRSSLLPITWTVTSDSSAIAHHVPPPPGTLAL